MRAMKSWSPLPLRLAIGIVFSTKGWWVLFEELGKRSDAFAEFGAPFPLIVAVVFGLVEFLGGLSLLLGLYARQASALLILIEVIAIGPAHMQRGFVQGSALNLLLIGGLLSVILSGSGRLSVKQ